MKEFIEIPFGAKDSELGGWEYNIPEGYTASIENGKIVVKKEESEDEKIREKLMDLVNAGARDGDVLYSLDSNQPFIYKERKQNEQATAYCGLNIYGKFFVWGTKDCVITLSKYVPATKEQRDLLFQKMKEAGYEWDAEKKELNLLITNGGDFFESENCEQKPTWTWSEKDEETLSRIRVIVRNYNSSRAEDILWLKSLKDRVQPQWKPSDEQMAYLVAAIEESDENCILQSLYNDLKKLIEK